MRRRKPKVVWLPPSNVNAAGDGSTGWSFASSTPFDGSTIGTVGAIEVPIVQDGNQSDPLGATSSLADIELSGYRLRRIVGKLYVFIGVSQDQAHGPTGLYGVSAGFIIRRVDPGSGGSLAAAVPQTNFEEINPSHIRNASDPWIWRRDWILNDGFFDPFTNTVPTTRDIQAIQGSSTSNFSKNYPGGNLEGPHVDQKTARIVGPEERLFLNISAEALFTGFPNQVLIAIYNFRVLGSMRSNIGNRRNASR